MNFRQRFCPNCGVGIRLDDKFCQICNHDLKPVLSELNVRNKTQSRKKELFPFPIPFTGVPTVLPTTSWYAHQKKRLTKPRTRLLIILLLLHYTGLVAIFMFGLAFSFAILISAALLGWLTFELGDLNNKARIVTITLLISVLFLNIIEFDLGSIWRILLIFFELYVLAFHSSTVTLFTNTSNKTPTITKH